MSRSDVLEELRYHPIPSKAEQILLKSTKKAFDTFGETSSRILLHQLSFANELSEDEFLMRHELVEESLRKRLGKDVSKIIQRIIKKEMLQYTTSRNPDLTIDEMLNEIRKEETLEFIRQRKGHEHIAFLHNKGDCRDRMLLEFFDGGEAPKGLLSITPAATTRLDSIVDSNMLYDEFLLVEKSDAMKNMSDWISKLHSSNNDDKPDGMPTKIAGEDAAWFLRNGLADEFLEAEKAIGRRVQDNISILCPYDISSGVSKKQLRKIVSAHGYVIFDEPPMVYERSDRTGNANR